MLDPMGQIQAEGFAWRQATTGKPNLMVVIGVWIFFLPALLAFGLIIVLKLTEGFRWTLEDLIGLAMPILAALVSAVLLYKTTANYRRRRKEMNGRSAKQDAAADAG
jgi:hypothetical protein